MKKLIAVVALAAVGFWALKTPEARAEGKVTCIVATNTTAAATSLITDAGTLCPWAAGSAVIMQCPDNVVCYDPSVGGTATLARSLCASFNSDADPILIGLNPSEKVISLILKGNSDGGASGICKFAETRRRIPAP